MSYILGLVTGLAGMFIIATFVIRSREREIKFYKEELKEFYRWLGKGFDKQIKGAK